jgi:GntR family transcriptional repressor for pyruvate dehydrogenase complex
VIARSPRGLRPIASLRAHEEVAEQLRRAIALRLVGAAGVLPPERELARRFGVGRATVQKAVALLEEEGLVERRRGRTGGTFLAGAAAAAPDAAALIAPVRRARDEIEEALAFRLAVEPAAAALAAEAASAGDLERVREAAEAAAAARDDAEFMEHDTAFHLAVARASRNRFLSDAVERIRLTLNAALAALPDSDAWHSWSNEEHAAVAEALAARDADAARAALTAHVVHADDAIRALLRSL